MSFVRDLYNHFANLLTEASTIRKRLVGVDNSLYDLKNDVKNLLSTLQEIRHKPYPVIVTIRGTSSYDGEQKPFQESQVVWVAKGLMKEVRFLPDIIVRVEEVIISGGICNEMIVASERVFVGGIRAVCRQTVTPGQAIRIVVYIPETIESSALFMHE